MSTLQIGDLLFWLPFDGRLSHMVLHFPLPHFQGPRLDTIGGTAYASHTLMLGLQNASCSLCSCVFNCPHDEMKLKRNSFKTVSKLFHFVVRTVLGPVAWTPLKFTWHLSWFRVTHYVMLDVILYAFYERNEKKRQLTTIQFVKTHT